MGVCWSCDQSGVAGGHCGWCDCCRKSAATLGSGQAHGMGGSGKTTGCGFSALVALGSLGGLAWSITEGVRVLVS